MKRVLVTGRAGYIGAHVCKALSRAGYMPITFDNLSTGWADAVRYGPLEQSSRLDRAHLDAAFAAHKPDAVIHFAALSLLGEAMSDLGRYWRTNLTGALNLVEAALASGCRDFIFSSTCATYGDRDRMMLDEGAAQTPLNAYGRSKRTTEEMLADFAASDELRPVIFRYFNVAGTAPDAKIGERHEPKTNVIPLVLYAALGLRPARTIHGIDYPTPDGTCLRVYVRVADLADAHVLSLKRLEAENKPGVFLPGLGARLFGARGHCRGAPPRDKPYHSRARRATPSGRCRDSGFRLNPVPRPSLAGVRRTGQNDCRYLALESGASQRVEK